MICVEKLKIRAGSFSLANISFTVPTGHYAVLMGKTGSGKTTLIEGLCGLRKVESGTIRLLNREVTHLKPAERGIGYVPQDRALFSSMNVWEHLAFALRIRHWSQEQIKERVLELADILGINRILYRKPQGLSGGESQRVALGRALSFHPEVLLLDEPLAALDSETRAEMHDLLLSVQHRTGVTTLHITHDRNDAEQLADHLFMLGNGVLEEDNDWAIFRKDKNGEAGSPKVSEETNIRN